MSYENLVPDPGAVSAGDFGAPELLSLNVPDPTPNVDFPAMNPTDLTSDPFGALTGATTGADLGSLSSSGPSSLDTSLLGFGENLTSALFGTFVTGPQLIKNQNQAAQNQAQISLATTSQLFSYLLIGVFLFLIVGFISKK